MYKPFAEYLTTHYLRISQIIGPAMSAGQKERVAGSMVRLMMDTGLALKTVKVLIFRIKIFGIF